MPENKLTDKPKKPRKPKATKPEVKAEPNPVGRPSEYTSEVGDAICGRLANGESLKKITDEKKMPAAPTVYRWIRTYEEFRNNYTRATEDRAGHMFDDMLEIADEGNPEDVMRARLRVDTRKWALSKMIPKKYGDKTALVGGDPETDEPIQVTDDRALARKLAMILTGEAEL